jgi:hypothetical protein
VSRGSGLQTLSAMKYATLLVLTAICLAAETSERCVTSIAIPVYPRLAEAAAFDGQKYRSPSRRRLSHQP